MTCTVTTVHSEGQERVRGDIGQATSHAATSDRCHTRREYGDKERGRPERGIKHVVCPMLRENKD